MRPFLPSRFVFIPAFAALLALALVAQPGDSDYQVQVIVSDMYHQLSIMWGNQGASQDAQSAFQKDVAQFNGFLAKKSLAAAQLQPCVQKYQQAYPHVVQQSKYYTQNNSQAFNREGAIANPLIRAGADCASRANSSDVFSTNTYEDLPSPPPQNNYPLYPQYPTPGYPSGGNPGRPPLQGGVSTNGGGQPPIGGGVNTGTGRPPIRGGVSQGGDACLPFGPGGYDYCNNPTQPPGCDCSKRNKRPIAGNIDGGGPGNNLPPPAGFGQPQTPSPARPWDPLGGKAQDSCRPVPASAWPPLVALQNALQQITARYDVTRRSDAGLLIMQDSLMNLGFGWALKGAGAVARALATRAAARLPYQVFSWATPRLAGNVFVPLTSIRQMPAGASIPVVLENTPRPLFLQEEPTSCALACVKMVTQTVLRKSMSEGFYRQLAQDACVYTPGVGTEINGIARLIQQAGVPANLETGQTVQQLLAATRNGYPAVVALGSGNAGHAVVVDGFTKDAAGNWYVLARDPWNLNLLDANAKWSFQQLGFKNYAVYSLADFTGPGGWSGSVIYTRP
jgi:hypothetical protein